MTRRATAGGARGYFEIGVHCPKTETNIGTLWRGAYQLGACGVFTVGRRYRQQASDTPKTLRHIPVRNFQTFDEWMQARPQGAELVGIEMGGRPLADFTHPQRAVYLLGAEDYGLPADVLDKCQRVVSLRGLRGDSYNVAVAGTLVMYHRQFLSPKQRSKGARL